MSESTFEPIGSIPEDIGLLTPESIAALRSMYGCMIECRLVGGWISVPIEPDKPMFVGAQWIWLTATPVGPAPRYLPLETEPRREVWISIEHPTKELNIDRLVATSEQPSAFPAAPDGSVALPGLTMVTTFIGRFRPLRQIDIVTSSKSVSHMDYDISYGRFSLDYRIELVGEGQTGESEVRFIVSRSDPGSMRSLQILHRPPVGIGQLKAGMEAGKSMGDLRLSLRAEG